MHDNERQAICASFPEVPKIHFEETTESLNLNEPLLLELKSIENNEIELEYGRNRAVVPIIFCNNTVFVAKHRNYDHQLFFWINNSGKLKVAFIIDYLSFHDVARETLQIFSRNNPGEYI